MGDTSISWTQRPGTRGRTWNPTNGCEVTSPGCANCYAMRFAGRFSGPGQRYHGLVKIGKNKRAIWTGESRLETHMLDLPLRWRDPSTVFVNSMSDLFYDGFSNEQIAAVFGVMAACPQHTFQILTKRAHRMREWFTWVSAQGVGQIGHRSQIACSTAACEYVSPNRVGYDTTNGTHRASWPLPNVWCGVSVENQAAADERIPELRETPAAVRFLSLEPLLGHIAIAGALKRNSQAPATWLPPIDWVIAGCESGPCARPCIVALLRSLRDQCADARVPFFLKQATGGRELEPAYEDDWERDHRLQGITFGPGSKRKAGNVIELPYLDGVQHAAFPEVHHG
jgi:protein gp37